MASAAPAAVAGAVYVAAAIEPNLSGVWTEGGDRVVRVFHNGSHVRGVFDGSDVTSFEGRFVSDVDLEGYITLRWEDEPTRERCGAGRFRSISYRARVDWENGTITERWAGPQVSDSCVRSGTHSELTTLRRADLERG